MIGTFDELMAAAARITGCTVVVAAPTNAATFEAIDVAHRSLPVNFLLIGDRETINRGIPADARDPARMSIVHHPDMHSTLRASIEASTQGPRRILMKGSIDTATLMKAVLDDKSDLRTGGLLSDVFVFEYPPRTQNAFIMITDGGVTVAPDLKAKAELIRNAVEVAHALGNPAPRVAVLSATEFVTPGLPSTVDAAALSKMNERGQIQGCIVDGPLALDNAVSPEAVQEKGIVSQVAGRAEILVAPTIEAANCLAKATTLFAASRLAHVIVGARIPILIPSRADRSDAKVLSIALGMIMAEAAERVVPAVP